MRDGHEQSIVAEKKQTMDKRDFFKLCVSISLWHKIRDDGLQIDLVSSDQHRIKPNFQELRSQHSKAPSGSRICSHSTYIWFRTYVHRYLKCMAYVFKWQFNFIFIFNFTSHMRGTRLLAGVIMGPIVKYLTN